MDLEVLELPLTMKVYPNPNTGQFFFRHSDSTLLKVSVRSLDGHKVFEREALPTGSSPIDLSHIAKGMYVLEVETEKGIYFTKLVLQ